MAISYRLLASLYLLFRSFLIKKCQLWQTNQKTRVKLAGIKIRAGSAAIVATQKAAAEPGKAVRARPKGRVVHNRARSPEWAKPEIPVPEAIQAVATGATVKEEIFVPMNDPYLQHLNNKVCGQNQKIQMKENTCLP
jgi:hypothetical protein